MSIIAEDTDIEFNKVLKEAFKIGGIVFRKKGIYLYDGAISSIEFKENFTNRNYDYFSIFTNSNMLVEYVLLGRYPISGQLPAHKVSSKYTPYDSETEENYKFHISIMKALKTNQDIIFKHATHGYVIDSVSETKDRMIFNILNSHYFLFIKDNEIFEFYRFDVRPMLNGSATMELPKL